jgi:hypothetical protein
MNFTIWGYLTPQDNLRVHTTKNGDLCIEFGNSVSVDISPTRAVELRDLIDTAMSGARWENEPPQTREQWQASERSYDDQQHREQLRIRREDNSDRNASKMEGAGAKAPALSDWAAELESRPRSFRAKGKA